MRSLFVNQSALLTEWRNRPEPYERLAGQHVLASTGNRFLLQEAVGYYSAIFRGTPREDDSNASEKDSRRGIKEMEREQADEVSHKLSCSQPGRPGGSNVGHLQTAELERWCHVLLTKVRPGRPFSALKITRTWQITLAVLMSQITLPKRRIQDPGSNKEKD